MNLNSLKVFYIAALEKSTNKASRRLNCVQSNVSIRIKRLEEELGITLFERSNKKIELTEPGKILFDFAEKILSMEKDVEYKLKIKDKPKKIFLGFDNLILPSIENLLRTINKKHTKIEFKYSFGNARDLLIKIMNHEIDGAITGSRLESPHVETISIFEDELILASNIEMESFIKSKSLHDLCFLKHGRHKEEIARFCNNNLNAVIREAIELNSIEAILGYASAGMGIAVLSKSTISKQANFNLFTTQLPVSLNDKLSLFFIKRRDYILSDNLLYYLDSFKKTDLISPE